MKMYVSVVLLILVMAGIRCDGAAPVQWSTAVGGNGHWYAGFAAPNGIGWSTAQSIAAASEGYLATIASPAESDFVATAVA